MSTPSAREPLDKRSMPFSLPRVPVASASSACGTLCFGCLFSYPGLGTRLSSGIKSNCRNIPLAGNDQDVHGILSCGHRAQYCRTFREEASRQQTCLSSASRRRSVCHRSIVIALRWSLYFFISQSMYTVSFDTFREAHNATDTIFTTLHAVGQRKISPRSVAALYKSGSSP